MCQSDLTNSLSSHELSPGSQTLAPLFSVSLFQNYRLYEFLFTKSREELLLGMEVGLYPILRACGCFSESSRQRDSVSKNRCCLPVVEDHWSDLFGWRSGAIGGGHASWHLFPLPGPAPYGEAEGGDVAVTMKETWTNPLRDRKGSCTIFNQTAAALLSYSKHSSFIWKYSINDQTSKSKSKSKWSGWQDIMLGLNTIKYVHVSKSSIYLSSYIFWSS